MRPAALLFGAGLLVGALTTHFLLGDEPSMDTSIATAERDTAASSRSRSRAAPPRAIDFLELVTGSLDTTERATLHRLAAEADRATLESLLAQVAALPKIASRAQALELLLPALRRDRRCRRGRIGTRARLGGGSRGAHVRVLGETRLQRCAARARRASRAAATTIGIALLEVFGNDDLGIIRVLGAAPQLDADRFRAEAADREGRDRS